ncbi:hypothetical protein ACFQH6_04680 [Halobacteriaceae archaeon GCM10025711]
MNLGTTTTLVLIALMFPIGTGAIVTRRPTLKWQEILLIGGTLIMPLVALLAILEFISPLATVIVLGLLTGHLLTHLDTD